MNRIIEMSNSLSNMISAGEVIENPVNVVKELVENSIDAGAKTIKISVIENGLSFVRIDDDGSGMTIKDARMSCKRHATSKIFSEKDLLSIKTLGFRGEALAAIASVSKVDIETKYKDNEGVRLSLEAGYIVKEQSIPRNVGTTIIVKSLFYNTPARFKFMSSEKRHQIQLRQLFYRFSLSRPDISFELIEDEKQFKKTSGSKNVKVVMDELFGQKYSERIDSTKIEIQNSVINIFYLPPLINVSNKNYIFTFINNRISNNFILTEAIIEAYENLMMIKRYPICICYIEVDPTRVDANIHPQKLKVKITNEQIIKYYITNKLKEKLTKRNQKLHTYKSESSENYTPQNLDLDSYFKKEELEEKEISQKLPNLDYLNLLSGTYGLFQGPHGLVLLDIHAAQERIRYEYYINKFKKDFNFITKRIVPFELSLDPNILSELDKYKETFKSYGFEFDNFGVISHPKAIREQDLDYAVDIIFDRINNGKSVDFSSLKNKLAKDVSCKSSITGNTRINRDEINVLYKRLSLCEYPYQCPHGRPTLVSLSYKEIEKMFKRII
jgi:DNA mismatch repair protein MutL